MATVSASFSAPVILCPTTDWVATHFPRFSHATLEKNKERAKKKKKIASDYFSQVLLVSEVRQVMKAVL